MWVGLILAALIAVGVVYYYATLDKDSMSAEKESSVTGGESTAGETADVEAELQAASLEGLDTELNDIDRELAE